MRIPTPLVLLLILTAAAPGCAQLMTTADSSWPKLPWSKEKFERASPTNPVVQVVTIWQLGEGQGLDGKTTRGFLGQILFITHEKNVPSIVDGSVRVYLFDDQGATPEERVKPLHQFDFSSQAWQGHLYNHALGAAYQVFIPYTRPGFHKAQCSLRVRLTPDDGVPIHSDMIAIALPGSGPELKPAAEPLTNLGLGAAEIERRTEGDPTNPSPPPAAPAPTPVRPVSLQVPHAPVESVPVTAVPMQVAPVRAVTTETPASAVRPAANPHPLSDFADDPAAEVGAAEPPSPAPPRKPTPAQHPLADDGRAAPAPAPAGANGAAPRGRLETFTIPLPRNTVPGYNR